MIRVGILGAGGMGNCHARCFKRIAGTRVVAVADIRHDAADALAAEHEAIAYYTIDALLREAAVDMVVVCLPTYVHASAVVAAAEAGVHVLCEKPLTLTLADADRMLAAVQRAGVKAMVAQVVRFMPHYRLIQSLYDRGDLGRPLMAEAIRIAPPPTWMTWALDPDLGGGALYDMHIHDLDYLYWLFGLPQRVYAVGIQTPGGGWNHVNTSLDYGDFKAVAQASLLMPPGWPFTMSFRLMGDKGLAQYPLRSQEALDYKSPANTAGDLALYLDGRQTPCPPLDPKDPYVAEDEYFVDCLTKGVAPQLATLEQARQVLGVVLAVKGSLETGRVAEVTDPK
jgi:UDP-N-acetylglucosamine 3-dehydrogenase